MVEPRSEVKQERSIVIPTEAAHYQSFEPADLISLPMSWQPPYPYRWEQVLFDGERLEEV